MNKYEIFFNLLEEWRNSEDYSRQMLFGQSPVLVTDTYTKENTGIVEYKEDNYGRKLLSVTTDFFSENVMFQFKKNIKIDIVEKGKADKIYINYAGGYVSPIYQNISLIKDITNIDVYANPGYIVYDTFYNCNIHFSVYSIVTYNDYQNLLDLMEYNHVFINILAFIDLDSGLFKQVLDIKDKQNIYYKQLCYLIDETCYTDLLDKNKNALDCYIDEINSAIQCSISKSLDIMFIVSTLRDFDIVKNDYKEKLPIMDLKLYIYNDNDIDKYDLDIIFNDKFSMGVIDLSN